MKNRQQLIRFGLVGGTNTLLDFGILFVLKSLGLPIISANIISTSVSFCFSFLANKKYTFKTTGGNLKREMVLFTVVTLFGLWILQSVVIKFIAIVMTNSGLSEDLILLIAKLMATAVSLVWNYLLYSRLVFKQIDKYS